MKTKTQEEINRMKEALGRQRDALPERSKFGDPNWEIIDAQLEVLDGAYLDEDAVYARFGDFYPILVTQ